MRIPTPSKCMHKNDNAYTMGKLQNLLKSWCTHFGGVGEILVKSWCTHLEAVGIRILPILLIN